jgi:hypothetical protein
MEWQGYEVSSEADYGVYSERSRSLPNVEYFVVVEDKRRLYGGGECQLCGEMLVAALDRYQNIKQDHTWAVSTFVQMCVHRCISVSSEKR